MAISVKVVPFLNIKTINRLIIEKKTIDIKETQLYPKELNKKPIQLIYPIILIGSTLVPFIAL